MLKFLDTVPADGSPAEEGSTRTVSWVLLTAAVVGLGIAVPAAVRGNATPIAAGSESQIATAVPDAPF